MLDIAAKPHYPQRLSAPVLGSFGCHARAAHKRESVTHEIALLVSLCRSGSLWVLTDKATRCSVVGLRWRGLLQSPSQQNEGCRVPPQALVCCLSGDDHARPGIPLPCNSTQPILVRRFRLPSPAATSSWTAAIVTAGDGKRNVMSPLVPSPRARDVHSLRPNIRNHHVERRLF